MHLQRGPNSFATPSLVVAFGDVGRASMSECLHIDDAVGDEQAIVVRGGERDDRPRVQRSCSRNVESTDQNGITGIDRWAHRARLDHEKSVPEEWQRRALG